MLSSPRRFGGILTLNSRHRYSASVAGWTAAASRQVLRALITQEPGIFRCVYQGDATWHGMARARLLSRSLGASERFHRIAQEAPPGLIDFTQLLFCLLIPHTDDFGRMSGSATSVKLTVHPGSYRNIADFQEALAVLEHVGLISLYDNGEKVLQVNKFEEHQGNLHKRTQSRFPDNSGKFPEIPGRTDLDLDLDLELNRTDLDLDLELPPAAAEAKENTKEAPAVATPAAPFGEDRLKHDASEERWTRKPDDFAALRQQLNFTRQPRS